MARRRMREEWIAPTSLREAKALHVEGLETARNIQQHFGHKAGRHLPRISSRGSASCSNAAPNVIRPADFGADPTGATDSSQAMAKAMAALLNASHIANHSMAAHIVDLGGATLDLDGGEYLISQPIVFPPFVGNAHVMRGTLRASKTFPSDKWLVMIGAVDCKPTTDFGLPDGQGCCNEFISMSEIFLDASHTAAGGVYVAHTMGATIGPSAFFVGFNDKGVRIDGGHEVMVQQAWFAEHYWSEITFPTLPPYVNTSTSIAIQINGDDHYVTDVIVFAFTHLGVEVNGCCALLQGVHAWNNFPPGVAIAVNAPGNRVTGSYLDFNSLTLTDPAGTVVENNFFLESHAVLRAGVLHSMQGIRFQNNMYAVQTGRPSAYPSIELQGLFLITKGIEISNEQTNGAQLKYTRVRKSLHLSHATRWEIDFAEELLLSSIEEVAYSLILDDDDGSFVRHVGRKPKGTKVVIETDALTSATVVVEVAQGLGKAWWPDEATALVV